MYAVDITITIDDTEYRVMQTITLGKNRFAEIQNIQNGTTYLLGGTENNYIKHDISSMEGLDNNTAFTLDAATRVNEMGNILRNDPTMIIAAPINIALSCCGAGYISYKLYSWAKKLKENAAIGKRYAKLITFLGHIKHKNTPA